MEACVPRCWREQRINMASWKVNTWGLKIMQKNIDIIEWTYFTIYSSHVTCQYLFIYFIPYHARIWQEGSIAYKRTSRLSNKTPYILVGLFIFSWSKLTPKLVSRNPSQNRKTRSEGINDNCMRESFNMDGWEVCSICNSCPQGNHSTNGWVADIFGSLLKFVVYTFLSHVLRGIEFCAFSTWSKSGHSYNFWQVR